MNWPSQLFKYRRYNPRLYLTVWITLAVAPLILTPIYQTVRNESLKLWQDEGSTVSPVTNTLDGEFRCVAPGGQICYGGSQVWIDQKILSLFSMDWIKSDPTVAFPGNTWNLIAKYPKQIFIMRAIRAGFAVLVLLFILFLGLRASPSLGIASALALGCLPPFQASFQGIKNDFSLVFFFLLFSILYLKAMSEEFVGRRLWLLQFCVILGVFTSFIKLQALPLICVLLGVAVIFEFLRKTPHQKIFNHLVLASILAVCTYAYFNPSGLINSEELRWPERPIFHFSNPVRWSGSKFSYIWLELRLWLRYMIPFLYLIVLRFSLISKTRFKNLLKATFFQWTPFLIAFVVLGRIHLQGLYRREAYYLPIAAVGLSLVLIEVARLRKLGKRWPIELSGYLVLYVISLSAPQGLLTSPRNIIKNWKDLVKLEKIQGERIPLLSKPLWVDVQARIPILESEMRLHKINFFDSMVDTPKALLNRIGEDKEAEVIAPCWSELVRDDYRIPDTIRDPVVDLWSEITPRYCGKESTPYDWPAVAAYYWGGSLPHYKQISTQTLIQIAASQSAVPKVKVDYIPIRAFEGSIDGADYWFNPTEVMYFEKNFELRRTFTFDRPLKEIKIHSASSCKRGGHLLVQVFQLGNGSNGWVSDQNISTDVSKPFCSYYGPRYPFDVCKMPTDWRKSFENWSKKQFDLPEISLKPLNGKTLKGTFELRIDGQLASGEPCRLFLETVQLVSEKNNISK